MNEENVMEIVLPGEFIAERNGRKLGRGVYLEGEKVYSKVLGIPKIEENEISVIPLAGAYIPKVGQKVVGIISEVEISGWGVDINSPYAAFLPLGEGVEEFVDISRTDLSKYYDINDIIYCKILKVPKNKIVQVSMRDVGCKKLKEGIIIRVTPTKVPRIIGKGGSMINLIKKKTGCEIIVGQNGVIWLKGERKDKAIEAILRIERESHVVGLTEKIEKMLGE
ncbi:MAG: exosome complex RNA-binding protein Rrp4 [Candidatus Aenigmarchaeota archaeon]|nr:exosome complex RNA-binding protein Rrp4 [Candidatus Aenigmarchaeota archaeon]